MRSKIAIMHGTLCLVYKQYRGRSHWHKLTNLLSRWYKKLWLFDKDGNVCVRQRGGEREVIGHNLERFTSIVDGISTLTASQVLMGANF